MVQRRRSTAFQNSTVTCSWHPSWARPLANCALCIISLSWSSSLGWVLAADTQGSTPFPGSFCHVSHLQSAIPTSWLPVESAGILVAVTVRYLPHRSRGLGLHGAG